MPDHPTITDIAAAIRKHSPGVLPEKIDYLGSRYPLCMIDTKGEFVPLPDDIARHVLGFAMVLDGKIHRHDGAWVVVSEEPFEGGRRWFSQLAFRDADHGGDALVALLRAWEHSRGLA